MHIKDFMEVCNYRITEGSDYGWNCFGPNAYRLDSWNGDIDGHSISIVFDTHNQTVYQVEAYDYTRQRAYRWTNPTFRKAHDEEVEDRDIIDMAWENDSGEIISYTELDVEADFLEKARAIVNEEDYDTRVQIEVEFSDEDLLQYMKLAHDLDITFNELVERAVKEAIKQHERSTT